MWYPGIEWQNGQNLYFCQECTFVVLVDPPVACNIYGLGLSTVCGPQLWYADNTLVQGPAHQLNVWFGDKLCGASCVVCICRGVVHISLKMHVVKFSCVKQRNERESEREGEGEGKRRDCRVGGGEGKGEGEQWNQDELCPCSQDVETVSGMKAATESAEGYTSTSASVSSPWVSASHDNASSSSSSSTSSSSTEYSILSYMYPRTQVYVESFLSLSPDCEKALNAALSQNTNGAQCKALQTFFTNYGQVCWGL